jgi:hypothetical protein
MLALCGAVACVLLGLVRSRIADDWVDAFGSEAAAWSSLAFIALVTIGAAFGIGSLVRQIALLKTRSDEDGGQ